MDPYSSGASTILKWTWPRGAGFCWGMMVEVRGSSEEWWKLSRNVGSGVTGLARSRVNKNSNFERGRDRECLERSTSNTQMVTVIEENLANGRRTSQLPPKSITHALNISSNV
nr:hypothetical protein [Tanacetum cinerariifolium]GEZ14126.1 hypothetical protein [Tanacetum cinerariifolium]